MGLNRKDLELLVPQFEIWKKNKTILDFLFLDGTYWRRPVARIINIGGSFLEIQYCFGSLEGTKQVWNLSCMHRVKEHTSSSKGGIGEVTEDDLMVKTPKQPDRVQQEIDQTKRDIEFLLSKGWNLEKLIDTTKILSSGIAITDRLRKMAAKMLEAEK